MGVKPTSNIEQQIADAVKDAEQRLHERLITRLSRIGEDAVSAARKVATKGYAGASMPYTVQTGNLTSSIGYVIVANGEVVNISKFETVKGENGNGAEGAATGRQLALDLVSNYPTGYALILVAGMHYATYVQDKGYDVLVSGSLLAEKLMKELTEKFKLNGDE